MVMTKDIVVEFDPQPFAQAVDDLVRSQVPFAAAVALTRTAKDVRDTLREELSDHFVIRNTWTARGIQFRRATKKKPEAVVGHRQEYMRLQAEGGTKLPTGGRKTVPVPIRARRGKKGKTTRSRLPRALIQKGRAMIAPTRKASTAALYTMRGKGERTKLTLMWLLPTKVRVNATWPFSETVERVVRERWGPNAVKALEEAVASRMARNRQRRLKRVLR